MAPTRIMMIRHAEKPDKDHQGVTYHGAIDSKCLIPRGWARAGALVRFFAPVSGSTTMTPTIVYSSSRESKSKDAGSTDHSSKEHEDSQRPYETVHPLATLLGVTLNDSYEESDWQAMMTNAEAQSGVVLIAWQHEDIPNMASSLNPTPAAPSDWPGDRFDVVWIFDADSLGGWAFSQMPQQLLAGDTDSVIA